MSFTLLKHDAGMDKLKTFLECPFSKMEIQKLCHRI